MVFGQHSFWLPYLGKDAANTYKTLEKYKLLSPEKIIDAGWDFLIDPVMREGGYVRYDNQILNQAGKEQQVIAQ
ncbi:MAG: hypothetical protein KAX16_00230 [Actinomycetia bacterium]|nr:hypothetical protein [Actinomycetes bacterium]